MSHGHGEDRGESGDRVEAVKRDTVPSVKDLLLDVLVRLTDQCSVHRVCRPRSKPLSG